MSLHYPTLGSVLLTVGILTSVMMIFIWRLYPTLQGTGLWAVGALLTTLGFFPMSLEPTLGNIAVVLNNIATITTPLLIFEGAIRFKDLHPLDHVRVPLEILYGIIYLLSTLLNLDNARGRYMINDLLMMIVLALTIVVLLWKEKGLERIVYMIISVTFALMFVAFFFRWLFSMLNSDFLNDPNQVLTPIIFLTLVPWAIGWSYGFILIINIKGRQALFDAARSDVLTGLNNRLWMTEQFDSSLKSATNKGKSLCLSVLDVDGFKHLNDSYGHMFGDEVLRHIGKVLHEQLADGDSAIRYGGDEFILLLACPKSGNNLTQKLRQIVEAVTEPTTIESVVISLSISFGNAHYPKDGTTSDELFKVADSRMYEQKRSSMK
ncbi:MAG: diguanylate cyclase [Sphaerochaeta sp.]